MKTDETDIVTDADRLEALLGHVKGNTQELLKQKVPSRVLIQNAIPRGMQLVRGQVDRQTVIDMCAIALTILIQET